MTKRFFLAQNRLLISLPGYEASPSTPFSGMSFDSDGTFGGLILGRGVFVDPSPIYDDNPALTLDPHLDLACPNLRTGYSVLLLLIYISVDSAEGAQVHFDYRFIEGQYLNATTLRVLRLGGQDGVYSRYADSAGYSEQRPRYFMVIAA